MNLIIIFSMQCIDETPSARPSWTMPTSLGFRVPKTSASHHYNSWTLSATLILPWKLIGVIVRNHAVALFGRMEVAYRVEVRKKNRLQLEITMESNSFHSKKVPLPRSPFSWRVLLHIAFTLNLLSFQPNLFFRESSLCQKQCLIPRHSMASPKASRYPVHSMTIHALTKSCKRLSRQALSLHTQDIRYLRGENTCSGWQMLHKNITEEKAINQRDILMLWLLTPS